MVLNKPFGLAVQGGSGTTHHIDGMLASLADERVIARCSSTGSTATRPACCWWPRIAHVAAELGEIFRSRQAQKIYWALVEGVPKPAQGRISLYLAKGADMGEEREPRTGGRLRQALRRARKCASPGMARRARSIR